jgi:serine/threonine protein kinase
VQLKNLLKKNSVTVVDGRKEVIKVIGTPFGPLTRLWCRHEAGCLSKLAHLGFANAPKLISSTDTSFTMERIEGKSLDGREPIEERLFLRVMDMVRELHDLGFAHGNLRPNNILIRDGSEPVLIDFETCCEKPNPLFFLARFSDQVRLHLLWKSRVVQANPEIVGTRFPGIVSLAMFVITPISRLSAILKSAKKRVRKSLKGSAAQEDARPRSEGKDAGPPAGSRDGNENRDKIAAVIK